MRILPSHQTIQRLLFRPDVASSVVMTQIERGSLWRIQRVFKLAPVETADAALIRRTAMFLVHSLIGNSLERRSRSCSLPTSSSSACTGCGSATRSDNAAPHSLTAAASPVQPRPKPRAGSPARKSQRLHAHAALVSHKLCA
ncbi:hypothetical protein V7S43_010743 [Phytophthora oleae]|uniref:Uncharacterized protein n=1 Tax=Phytophthora oleae TaxID=2107226 RepID=A0ABD3FFW5_9STRA